MKWFTKLIDLLLYGNFWIAACATALCMQTRWVVTQQNHLSTYCYFVFFSTLSLYAIHRIVGLEKVQKFTGKGRYHIISRYRKHIMLYAVLGGVVVAFLFFLLPISVQLALVVPSFISLAYVLPVFQKKRRLRDINYIKIFLIALVWAWVTVILPLLEVGLLLSPATLWLFLERAVFIFLITLPFDIRDRHIDQYTDVKTLPLRLGKSATMRLGYWIGGTLMLLIGVNYYLGWYTLSTACFLLAFSVGCVWLVRLAYRDPHDYFFTGLVDGTMLFSYLLVVLGSVFSF